MFQTGCYAGRVIFYRSADVGSYAMPQNFNARFLVPNGLLAVVLAVAGCSRVVPDEPAKLTPEQEQEILMHVEQASAGERNGVP